MNTNHHTIEIGEDGIAHVEIIGDGDTAIAEKFVADAELLFEQHPNIAINAVVNMSKSGFSNLGGIDVYRDFLKNERLNKIAFVGTNIGVKAMIELATSDRTKPTEFFGDEESAMNWIKAN